MADNSYAVSNLRTIKENIMAYASYAEGYQYSPLYEKIEEAQAAVQRLIDAIEGKDESDDDIPEEVRKALAYVREQLDEDELMIIKSSVSYNLNHRLPAASQVNDGKLIDLLEEYGEDNDLPEGWWEEYGDIEDVLMKL